MTKRKEALEPVSGSSSVQARDSSAAPTTAPRNSFQSRRHNATSSVDVPRYRVDDVPPPSYGQIYGSVDLSEAGFRTAANIADDGRINIRISQRANRLSELLAPALHTSIDVDELPPPYMPPTLVGVPGERPPPLNLVMQVVGSRGDVQPFVALGKFLKEKFGHRVRIATHSTFKDFVELNGLEFFSIGGDPAELMSFMVKNPGLLPGFDAIKSGDIRKRRKCVDEILTGCWRSCIEPGDGMGIAVSDNMIEGDINLDKSVSMGGDLNEKPFVADAIIANPPSFAHVHISEKLGIPVHLMFTMPWSPTQYFPHPLATVISSDVEQGMTNFLSYALVEMLIYQGLGDIINRFREKTLRLDPISQMWLPGIVDRLKIPYTYCWSPALMPKPRDWGSHINISGYYFLSQPSNYTPDPNLLAFLDSGPPPIYIGFGSIVITDPNALTKIIFDAIQITGQRALVSKGWGGLPAEDLGIPEDVFMLDTVPHEWLFRHVSCVVHHGGAGTTATGIAYGRPTVVIPFFGDQSFWGSMVARAGAGPEPIDRDELTADNLANAIMQALEPSMFQKAGELASKISTEMGVEVGAQSFHKHLNLDSMRCMIDPSRVAVWKVKHTKIRLSAFAVAVLASSGLLTLQDVKLYRSREYQPENAPWDPFTSGASAIIGIMTSLMMGIADLPLESLKSKKAKGKTPVSKQTDDNNVEGSTNVSKEHNGRSNEKSQTSSGATTPAVEARSGAYYGKKEFSRSSSSLSQSNYSTSNNVVADASMKKKPSPTSKVDNQSIRSMSSCTTPSNGGPREKKPMDTVIEAGKGVSRLFGTGLRSPLDLSMAMVRGFQNAPRLYGDTTVRPTHRVTDFQSGLKAAGKGLGEGIYDGVSGLFTQPYEGAKKEGLPGFLKGFGKGIGGLVLKPPAAFWGLPGYTFQGIYKEILKHSGPNTENWIIAARTAQGLDDAAASSEQQRRDVLRRWGQIKLENPRRRILIDDVVEQSERFQNHLSETRKKKKEEKASENATNETRRRGTSRRTSHHSSQSAIDETVVQSPHRRIRSIPETGERGAASVSFSATPNRDLKKKEWEDERDEEGEWSRRSTEAPRRYGVQPDPFLSPEKPGFEYLEDDEELRNALHESKRQHEADELKAKTEDDIILEYIKKQSLAETEYKRNHQRHQPQEEDDDEEYLRALRESRNTR